jgi:hypothetical protein
VLARQALYHLSHTFCPLSSGYFGAQVLLFAQGDLDYDSVILSFPHSWNDRNTPTYPAFFH